MNRGVVRLIAHSLVAAAAAASSRGAGKSKGAKSPEEIANLEGAAAMRSLLSEEILPHFEEAGWRLTAPLKTLWAAAATMKPPNLMEVEVTCEADAHWQQEDDDESDGYGR